MDGCVFAGGVGGDHGEIQAVEGSGFGFECSGLDQGGRADRDGKIPDGATEGDDQVPVGEPQRSQGGPGERIPTRGWPTKLSPAGELIVTAVSLGV